MHYRLLLRIAQTLQAKWMMGDDFSFSDKLGYAPADDQNSAEDYKDNPYDTTTPKPDAPKINNQSIQQIRKVVFDATDATNYLLIDPRYQQSAGLKAFSQQFPSITNALNAMSPDWDSIKSILNGLSFYSNPSNKGTGFDPATTAKTGNYSSPADYLKKLMALVATFKA